MANLWFNTGIAGITKPAIGNQFSTWFEKTQVSNFDDETKKKMAAEIAAKENAKKPKLPANKPLLASTVPITSGRVNPVTSEDNKIALATIAMLEKDKTAEDIINNHSKNMSKEWFDKAFNLATDINNGSWLQELKIKYPDLTSSIIQNAYDAGNYISELKASDTLETATAQQKPLTYEEKLTQKLWNLTPEQINAYKQKFDNLKGKDSPLYRLYKTPEGNNAVSQIFNAIRWKYKDVWYDEELWGYIYEQQKSWSDIAMNDLWATPSVIAWAVSVPLKAWATLIDLWGKAIGKDINLNQWVDKLAESLWVKRDGWFNTSAMITEVWLTAMGVEWIIWAIGTVWELWAIITKYPKIAKYIAKPILEGIGYQAGTDLVNEEASTVWQYAKSAWLSFGLNALWGMIGWVWNKFKRPDEYYRNAVKDVNYKTVDEISDLTDKFKADPNNFGSNPLIKSQKELDTWLDILENDRGVVGEQLWEIRKTLQWIDTQTDDILIELNKDLSNITNTTIKQGKKWALSFVSDPTRISKVWVHPQDQTVLKTIFKDTQNAAWQWKASSLEDLSGKIKAFLKEKWAMSDPVRKALYDFNKKLDTRIWTILEKSWMPELKAKYKKIMEMKETLEKLTSENWSKGLDALSKIKWPKEWAEIKQLLADMKEMGLTQNNLIDQITATNYIMANKLSKPEFQQALDQFYPSVPWMYEAGIKWVKSLLVNPTKELRKVSQWFKKGQQKMQSGKLSSVTKQILPIANAENNKALQSKQD